MKINVKWHIENKIQKNPSKEQRLKWHIAHFKYCSCRPIPEQLLKEIKKRKLL